MRVEGEAGFVRARKGEMVGRGGRGVLIYTSRSRSRRFRPRGYPALHRPPQEGAAGRELVAIMIMMHHEKMQNPSRILRNQLQRGYEYKRVQVF